MKPDEPTNPEEPKFSKFSVEYLNWFPPLERADRLALVENLNNGSCWSVNFGVMLGSSVIIAGLGSAPSSVWDAP